MGVGVGGLAHWDDEGGCVGVSVGVGVGHG